MILSFKNELGETVNVEIANPPSERHALKLAYQQLRNRPGHHSWTLKEIK